MRWIDLKAFFLRYMARLPAACKRVAAVVSAGAVALPLAVLAVAVMPTAGAAQTNALDSATFKSRHIGASREQASKMPRGEGDQARIDGWPLYRTERGQAAFNDAMATLKATDGTAPSPQAFKDVSRNCPELACKLTLPVLANDGWIPAGRIWVSPAEYVLIAHSPRNREGQGYRRRMTRSMQYFVFHEFHNSTRNTDMYDTVSSHGGSVFVPFYLGKAAFDAKGRRFVIVLQVAPYDVFSVHASNLGSNGPGVEVARNVSDPIDPLQNTAGVLLATIVKTAVPHLRVVNHRGREGLPMLEAYERRLAASRARAGAVAIRLPFVLAAQQRVATAAGRLEQVVLARGASPPIPVAERGIVPPAPVPAVRAASAMPSLPKLIGSIRLAVRPASRSGDGYRR